jgi:hypothetical protein
MDSKKVFDTSIRIGWRQKMSLTTLSESDGLIQAKSSRNKKGHDREDEILNYFVNRSTNAVAESLNARIKDFRAQLRGVIDKKFISCSFSRHAKTHASMVLVIWLNENVHIHARFLAMPKLMQAWFWSSGLTKTFIFMLVFSPRHSRCKHRSALLA